MGDLTWLGIYAASKVFSGRNFEDFDIEARKYSFNGEIIFDFKRNSFARIFPINRNKFNFFDYKKGMYLTVVIYKNNLGVYRT